MLTARERFVVVLVGWVSVSLLGLLALDVFTLELLFVCAFVGLLIARQLTITPYVQPDWQRRTRWLVGAGAVAFAASLVAEFLAMLPAWVF